ncbi:MAG: NAD(P)H-dependent glycerol-3-phosphate dehydrogenase [Candidatus Hatepunaea meridiana]|nr:NAD(P)H-dependent glycerol-3-phosphate dehydrogenase [Candidatus Hatepunaea meridiana]
MRIAVLGAGSWGTTLALYLNNRSHNVRLWEFRPDAVHIMQQDRENREFLPDHPFPPALKVTNNISEALNDAEVCLIAVPSHAVRETVRCFKDDISTDCVITSVTKGVEEGSLMRMSEVIADACGDRFSYSRFVCLTGPSHAEEVCVGLPTSIVAASPNIKAALFVQELMSSNRFRVYAIDDLIGAELGGSLKNVIAIAAGIAHGLGFGDNVMGALLTRGSTEMSRLGIKLGGRHETFAGLSGIGDLITTCCSQHSRNRYLGEQIGRGHKLKEILDEMLMVAEGVRTTRSAYALSQREKIEMPITEQVYRILFEDVDPLKATTELMTRKLKVED